MQHFDNVLYIGGIFPLYLKSSLSETLLDSIFDKFRSQSAAPKNFCVYLNFLKEFYFIGRMTSSSREGDASVNKEFSRKVNSDLSDMYSTTTRVESKMLELPANEPRRHSVGEVYKKNANASKQSSNGNGTTATKSKSSSLLTIKNKIKHSTASIFSVCCEKNSALK